MSSIRVFPALARTAIVTAILASTLAACSHHDDDSTPSKPPAPQFSADVTRTTHGVVHVKAADFRSLGYGLAYACACLPIRC
jgi:acyl-homoserine-lactone acylase